MFFCFFKQKTAYEMRISDWSSDVCSSDLLNVLGLLAYDRGELEEAIEVLGRAARSWRESGNISGLSFALAVLAQALLAMGRLEEEIGRASCRERVCQYV